MNKIICDLCGTSYPETQSQCPICGTAKTDASVQRPNTADNYAYVKGGRFSQSNVRKRNGAAAAAGASAAAKPAAKPSRNAEPVEQERSNKPLVIVVCILLAAVLCIAAYIGIFILTNEKPSDKQQESSDTNQPVNTPCEGITLSQNSHAFTDPKQTLLLNVTLQPAGCTDKITVESSNENIVTAEVVENNQILIKPLTNGNVTITIYCGGNQVQCTISSQIGVEPDVPDVPDVPDIPDVPDPPVMEIEIVLNREDFTMNKYGETWNLCTENYQGPAASEITWTSSDPAVATVENGVVTAIGSGRCIVTAEYQGKTDTCIVRCTKNVVAPAPEENLYELNVKDFTVEVGKNASVKLVPVGGGANIQGVTYSVEDDTICSVDDKGVVTGLKAGTTNVLVEYEGKTYKCIVRVKAAA